MQFFDEIRQSFVQHFVVGEVEFRLHVVNVTVLHVLQILYATKAVLTRKIRLRVYDACYFTSAL